MTAQQQQQPILTNEEQYHSDLKRIVHRQPQEMRRLEALARQGDAIAKEQIIEECMLFVRGQAYRLATAYLPQEYLDLIQVGNLTLVERIDYALGKDMSTAYLCGAARLEMRSYCFFRSRLIRIPTERKYLEEAPHTISYEVWAEEPLAALAQEVQPHEQVALSTLYGPLQEALANLPEHQRITIERLYGLDGERPETLAELDRRFGLNGAMTHRHKKALQQLRQHLKQA